MAGFLINGAHKQQKIKTLAFLLKLVNTTQMKNEITSDICIIDL